MAAFAEPSQTSVPPDYTNSSQGPRATSNDALGQLFGNLAKTLDTGVHEADRAEREKITDDIMAQSDAIQNEFGVGDATDVQSDAESTAPAARPAALERAYSNLDSLQNAYEKGALKESHYWARMNVMVRQLRAKYPGYRQDIDNMVADVVGAKPANALQAQLFNEWQADAAAKNKPTPLSQLEEWATKEGALPTDYFKRQQEGNAYTYPELASYVADKTRAKADVASRQAQMSMEIDQNNLDKTKLENNFRLDAEQFVQTLMQDGTKSFGKTYQEVQKKINQAQLDVANGKPINTEEMQGLAIQLSQLKQYATDALNQQFISSWDGDPNHSYAGHLDANTQADVIKQALMPIDLLMSAFGSSDKGNPYAILSTANSVIEAQKSQEAGQLMKQIGILPKLSALSGFIGSDAVGIYLAANPKVQDALTQALVDNSSLDGALGTGTVDQAMSTGEQTGAKPDYYNALMQKWVNLSGQIDSGKIPLEVIQHNVQYMFGNMQSLAKLDDASRYLWFNTVASPMVTKQMLKLKNMGDTASWNTYQNWVKQGFINLFQQSMNTISRQINTGLIRWDNDTSSFDYVPSRDPGFLRPINQLPFGIGTYMSQLNSAISTVKPIIEDNGGDTKRELMLVLLQTGYAQTAAGKAMLDELGSHVETEGRPKGKGAQE